MEKDNQPRQTAADIYSPFHRPIYMMAKPAGAACNLACGYCYYLDKASMAPGGRPGVMSDETLEHFIRSYIEAQPTTDVLFTWHGGEPLLRGIKFYERALALQCKYAGGHRIDNCIQTNGTLINRDWCGFFRDNGFLVGLSIDGSRVMHNRYRLTSDGRPTWAAVTMAAALLDLYGVEWNAMAVVSRETETDPLGFYRYFRDELKCRYLQFAPLVEREHAGRLLSPDDPGGVITPFSVTPQGWGEFLCAVYDEWVIHDVGSMFVQLFDATLANWAGQPPGLCTLAPDCGHALVLEHDGTVYSCDHFVYPDHCLGNISDTPIPAMFVSPRQREFAERSRRLPKECLSCQWLHLCHGECPKNRIVPSSEPGKPLNYLCPGYKRFFSHSASTMQTMLALWQQGKPASEVMKHT
ncbi:MAG: anaerobic sulfatase-maturation protein [Muribaculaceae bacterium]|nr:anaerobic sulfatase-maturation protein [Muribaculaceae bacterium]